MSSGGCCRRGCALGARGAWGVGVIAVRASRDATVAAISSFDRWTDPRGGLRSFRVVAIVAALGAAIAHGFAAGVRERHNLPVRPLPTGSAVLDRPSTLPDGRRVHHMTVATHPDQGVERFLRSASWHGASVAVLGAGDSRLVGWGAGLGVKVEYMLEFVSALQPDDLVLFTDAYDVLMLRGHGDVVRGYDKAVARRQSDPDPSGGNRAPTLLIGAERQCSPDVATAEAYPASDRTHRFAFLNSGTFIGPARDVQAFLRAEPVLVEDNDQVIFHRTYLRSLTNASLPRTILDHENDVFLTLSGPEDHFGTHVAYLPAERRWRHEATEGLPSIFHSPGWVGFKDAGAVWSALQGRYCVAQPCGYDAPMLTRMSEELPRALVIGIAVGALAIPVLHAAVNAARRMRLFSGGGAAGIVGASSITARRRSPDADDVEGHGNE